MTDLRGVVLDDSYRSSYNDVVRDFYLPCLRVATRYDRAVGYFTSGSLAVVAEGVEALERAGGNIRLIASPNLRAEDVEQINRGYALRSVAEGAVLREMESISLLSGEKLDRIGLLARLIANGNLDIKIALMRSSRGAGIYHEKIGVITDAYGNQVAFTGSLNETAAAFLDNFESIQVFRSWEEADARRSSRIQRDFEDLWTGRTPALEVFFFPEAARRKLIEIGVQRGFIGASPRNPVEGWPTLPESIALRDYQKKAVEAWLESGGRGIFEMATGTGKTITALAAADQLGRQLRVVGSSLVTIVVVPLLALADQWSSQLREFGVVPIQCREAWRSWEPSVRDALAALVIGEPRNLVLVVTNTTFVTDRFQELIRRVPCPLFILADEVHNLGSERMRSLLPEKAEFRLGLSATPDRHLDPDGTEALTEYFGDVLIELGIKEAISLGALTPYRYYPVLVPLNEDEAELYSDLTKEIGRLYARQANGADVEERLGQVLLKRANVLGHAEGKIPALREELGKRQTEPYQLIYCATGSRPTLQGTSGIRQLDEAIAVSGSELRIPTHPYTAEEDSKTRRDLLKDFASGSGIRVLASMRCLDEGVDLPDARIAYMLASSSNPRQFIQRRGRVLRKAEGKKRADIVDFVAVPPGSQELFELERRLFRRELERCIEFARYADNQGYALSCLRDLREHYELMDV
ncbi:DEAD/DEAH box helicase family protein [Streptomyces flavalbus]|uniref:DEAD/DEAH box helicase family protein n=1 Tax=Streptomyces flavalbus TaxID=2665155 RepID=A0ABW2WC18_9ACTN